MEIGEIWFFNFSVKNEFSLLYWFMVKCHFSMVWFYGVLVGIFIFARISYFWKN